MRSAVAESFDPKMPFSRAQARANQIPEASLAGRSYQKICFDQYVAAGVPITCALRARSAINISPPETHVSHHTAAELWGAPPPPTVDTHITVPSRKGRPARRGIRAHHATRSRPATTIQNGLPISTPEQTFLDLAAAAVDLVDLVVVGDGLVKAKVTTPKKLMTAAASSKGAGAKLARRAAGFVRDGVDSAPETRVRMLLVLAGLPEPETNVILRRPDGTWRRRLDMALVRYRLGIEYDGRQHAEDEEQWIGDIERREELDRDRIRLVIVTARGIWVDPLHTLVRVRDVLVELGAKDVPRKFSDEWRRHFPGRG